MQNSTLYKQELAETIRIILAFTLYPSPTISNYAINIKDLGLGMLRILVKDLGIAINIYQS